MRCRIASVEGATPYIDLYVCMWYSHSDLQLSLRGRHRNAIEQKPIARGVRSNHLNTLKIQRGCAILTFMVAVYPVSLQKCSGVLFSLSLASTSAYAPSKSLLTCSYGNAERGKVNPLPAALTEYRDAIHERNVHLMICGSPAASVYFEVASPCRSRE